MQFLVQVMSKLSLFGILRCKHTTYRSAEVVEKIFQIPPVSHLMLRRHIQVIQLRALAGGKESNAVCRVSMHLQRMRSA